MVEIIAGLDARAFLDRIAGDLVRVRETSKGGIITTPVLFPSGAHVTVRVVLDRDHCLITDDGAAFHEAEMMGAGDLFRRAAKASAETAGINFNSFEIFEAKASAETAAGMIAIVADTARRAIHLTAERLAKRLEVATRLDVVDRLIDVYGASRVDRDVAISGASTHAWNVDAFVRAATTTIAVEIVTPAPTSVSASFVKLDDIRRLEAAPRTVAALTSRKDFRADQLVILGRAATFIDAKSATSDSLRRLAA